MYFYRFLRTTVNQLHPSEINNDIEFYTSQECGNNRDFTWNEPVKEKIKAGQSVQLLFGMSTLDSAVKVLGCFGCYGRLLARFNINHINSTFSINPDKQVNERVGSQYIMADYSGNKISIPGSAVQILSLSGWVEKSEATRVLAEIVKLSASDYEQLILNT
ncbi:hypothetical protein [Pseudomonas sp. S1_E04]